MVTAVGGSGLTRAIDLLRGDAAVRSTPTQESKAPKAGEATSKNPVAMLAAAGVPIDAAKVASVRQAIAQGQYPIDPQRIAHAMINLDLPPKS